MTLIALVFWVGKKCFTTAFEITYKFDLDQFYPTSISVTFIEFSKTAQGDRESQYIITKV